jgi:cupin 2 domain-containing protein
LEVKNIFDSSPGKFPNEIIETLLVNNNIKIERIISSGQSSTEGFWYDQDKNEWVILLSGSAALLFENEEKERMLKPGDYIFIPAHLKHRVNQTDKYQNTVWLAIFFE